MHTDLMVLRERAYIFLQSLYVLFRVGRLGVVGVFGPIKSVSVVQATSPATRRARVVIVRAPSQAFDRLSARPQPRRFDTSVPQKMRFAGTLPRWTSNAAHQADKWPHQYGWPGGDPWHCHAPSQRRDARNCSMVQSDIGDRWEICCSERQPSLLWSHKQTDGPGYSFLG